MATDFLLFHELLEFLVRNAVYPKPWLVKDLVPPKRHLAKAIHDPLNRTDRQSLLRLRLALVKNRRIQAILQVVDLLSVLSNLYSALTILVITFACSKVKFQIHESIVAQHKTEISLSKLN